MAAPGPRRRLCPLNPSVLTTPNRSGFTDANTSHGIAPQLRQPRQYSDAVDGLLVRENAAGDILFGLTDYLGGMRGWVRSDGTLPDSVAYENCGLTVGAGLATRGSYEGGTSEENSPYSRVFRR